MLLKDESLLRYYIRREKQRIHDNSKTFDLSTFKILLPSWEVIELERFRRLYNSGLFHIRLILNQVKNNNEPILFIVLSDEYVLQSPWQSIDIKQLVDQEDDLVSSPTIVQELLNSLDVLDCGNRYVFLRYEGYGSFWEVLGCQSLLNKDDEAPSGYQDCNSSPRLSTPSPSVCSPIDDECPPPLLEPVSPVVDSPTPPVNCCPSSSHDSSHVAAICTYLVCTYLNYLQKYQN